MIAPFSPVEVHTEIAAGPVAVWDVLSDPDTYPDWLVGAQRTRAVEPHFPRPGSAFHHSVGPSSIVTIDDVTEATDADPPHRLDLLVHVGPFRADVEFLIVPSPQGSEVRLRERPKGPWALLTPLVRPILHARNAESLRRLSDLFKPAYEGASVDETRRG